MKILISLLCWFIVGTGDLSAQNEPYRGKTLTIIVGSAAGTVYDIYARLVGRHVGKHLPGNPDVIVQNMPAAGSLVAANYIYGVAKPDGLTVVSVNPALYFNQLQGQKEVKYDWAKFGWIASTDKSDHLMYMRADSPYKSLQDVRRSTERPKCGATGAGTSGHYIPRLLEDTLGTKFNVVTGYPGGNDIDLAVERGELHCRALTIAAYFAREPYHTWRKTGFARIIVQTGRTRDPLLADAPTLGELMDEVKTPQQARRLARVLLASGEFGRPLVSSPGLPADRLKLLRDGFMAAMADGALLAEADRQKLEITPSTGEELARLAREVMDQPPPVIDRMKKILREQ
jgi:tripartite-type tricarboxylate transporter receptor subunit TctC